MSSRPTPVPSPVIPLAISGLGLFAVIGLMIAGNREKAAIVIFVIVVIWLIYLLKLLFQSGIGSGRGSNYAGDVGGTGSTASSGSSGGWFSGAGDSCDSGDSGGGGDCGGGGD